MHGAANVVTVALFATAWWLRAEPSQALPTATIFGIEVVALGLGAVGGWLGGELVDRLAVGVDDGAHLDAPSSLTKQSAGRRMA
jgi:uncharacterized membrane protein